MRFKKNNINKAFRSFRFLSEYGFSLKRYSRNMDREHVYSLNNIVLEIDYYLGFNPNKNTNMCSDGMCVAVILTVDDCRNNLLNCDKIFNAELLETLKTDVVAAQPIDQIPVYADFIKTNIGKLLQLKKIR